MKKTSGDWTFDLDLECPYCGEYLDEDNLLNGYIPLESYYGKVECHHCGKKLIAEINCKL